MTWTKEKRKEYQDRTKERKKKIRKEYAIAHPRYCRFCSKEFIHMGKGDKIYCSAKCRIKNKSNKNKKKRRHFYREILLNALGDECDFCKSRENLCVHHIIPICMGGNNTIGNVILLCRKCHERYHSGFFEKCIKEKFGL